MTNDILTALNKIWRGDSATFVHHPADAANDDVETVEDGRCVTCGQHVYPQRYADDESIPHPSDYE